MQARNLIVNAFLVLGLSLGACSAATQEGGDDPGDPPTDAPAESVGNREVASGIDGVRAIKVEILATGDGVEAKPGDTVKMHYVGTFLDGKKFDSSRDGGRPFGFVLGAGQVIDGWDLIGAEMRVGDHWKCTIPFELAYGPRGDGRIIPARADLVFDMELVDVISKTR